MVKIGSARSNEFGGINGGLPGDQKGGAEVSIQDWYQHPKGWIVIRAKDPAVRNKIADNMEAGCHNDHIGYCQNHRDTALVSAKPYGYDLSKVTKDVEVDCSKLVQICCLYAGVKVGDFSTDTGRFGEVETLRKTGAFDVLTDAEHCQKPDNLLRGDILVTKTKGHTVVVTSTGGNTQATTDATGSVSVDKARAANSAIAGTYATTASLNLRSGAGTDKKIIAVLGAGTKVRCYGYYTAVGGTNWYLVSVNGKTGFCSSRYLKKA